MCLLWGSTPWPHGLAQSRPLDPPTPTSCLYQHLRMTNFPTRKATSCHKMRVLLPLGTAWWRLCDGLLQPGLRPPPKRHLGTSAWDRVTKRWSNQRGPRGEREQSQVSFSSLRTAANTLTEARQRPTTRKRQPQWGFSHGFVGAARERSGRVPQTFPSVFREQLPSWRCALHGPGGRS